MSLTLSLDNIVEYLFDEQLLSAKDVVDREFTAHEFFRRHYNFVVLSKEGPSLLLKQGIGKGKVYAINHEAEAYKFLIGQKTNLNDNLPKIIQFDEKNNILVLEYLKDAEDLSEYHRRKKYCSSTLARSLGKVLGALHKCPITNLFSKEAAIPWILAIHRPSSPFFKEISSSNLELIKIIQHYREFENCLNFLQESWKNEVLIHKDLKWNNFLACSKPGSKRRSYVKVIDWEFMGKGDPDWDVGSVFAQYLSLWLSPTPIMEELPPEEFLSKSTFPLENLHPPIKAFWSSYADQMNYNLSSREFHLRRAVLFSASRILQEIYEKMQGSFHLTSHALYATQLSYNIMMQPEQAAVTLLGLSLK